MQQRIFTVETVERGKQEIYGRTLCVCVSKRDGKQRKDIAHRMRNGMRRVCVCVYQMESIFIENSRIMTSMRIVCHIVFNRYIALVIPRFVVLSMQRDEKKNQIQRKKKED